MNRKQEKTQDNIPQRPFRRLSGSSGVIHDKNGLCGGLFSVREGDDDNNSCCNSEPQQQQQLQQQNDACGNHHYKEDTPPKKPCSASTVCKEDTPPKKPCSASTVFDDSTVPTYLDDTESLITSSDGSVRFATPSAQASYEQVKAREQPNSKVLTVPLDPEGRKYASTSDADFILLQKRKEMVESYWNTLRQRDLEGYRNLLSDDFRMVCVGSRGKVTCELTVEDLIPAAKAVFDSLPDFRFMYRDISEHKELPGCLVLHEFVGSGTHTGTPFALGPLPAIPTTNKLIVLDECESIYHFDPITNKICKLEEIAMGETTGIPGIYTLLSKAAEASAADQEKEL